MTRRALIHSNDLSDARLVTRTARSLTAAGWDARILRDWSDIQGPVLIARAGAWLQNTGASFVPEGDGFVGVGATSNPAWKRVVARCGGDFRLLAPWQRRFPRLDAVYLSEEAAARFIACFEKTCSFEKVMSHLVFRQGLRAVHLPSLDVHFDLSLRVLQALTTLQIGGAERVTLDLADGLNDLRIPTAIAVLDQPARETLPAPRFCYNLANTPATARQRAEAIRDAAVDWGADIIHAHLISAEEARAIHGFGLPLALTLHNMPQGWPRGYDRLCTDGASLLVACSQAVEAAAAHAGLQIPIRTAWNGVRTSAFVCAAEHRRDGTTWRTRLGIKHSERMLLCIANPRAQKRLPLLPQLLQALDGTPLPFHIAIAGGPLDHPEVLATLRKAAHLGVADRLHWLGVVADSTRLLTECDALVSVSAWEGLSIAHLEALAAGKPVVATAVGGTAEIAAQHPHMYLVSADATAAAIAAAVRRATEKSTQASVAFPGSFTRHAMARRYRWLYRRTIGRYIHHQNRREQPRGLWLITNNFSTGGAQSSARRLLLGLQTRGVKVRAAVIEESPSHPTPGRRALTEAGVHVVAIQPPAGGDAPTACEQLLEKLDSDPGEVVVFWNLITSYKVLLADALLDTRVFDVSPGEMFFTALERYFTKPLSGLPYVTTQDYGRRLAGVVVKYSGEAVRAAQVLACPAHVIPNGVELPALVRPAARPQDVLKLTTAARLSPDKRLEDLFDALRLSHSRLPPYRLWIAGGIERGHSAYARQLRRRARGLPITWCGELPDIGDLLAHSDIFLMISEPAGCPNVSLEALAAGVPVVATDVGGASEQITNDITGKLVPRRDAMAFAAALLALAGNESLRLSMRRNARRHIERSFSMKRMLDRYSELLFEGGSAAHADAAVPGFEDGGELRTAPVT